MRTVARMVPTGMSIARCAAARADEQGRRLLGELVVLLGLRIVVADRAADGVVEVLLADGDVVPIGARRVLEIGHEHVRARVERVDDHLPVRGAGDLYAAVAEVVGDRRDRPLRFADLTGLG